MTKKHIDRCSKSLENINKILKKTMMRFITLHILDYKVESWIMLSLGRDKGICSAGGSVDLQK